MTTVELDGAVAHDIPGFYAEINRLFMTEQDWQIGQSLDALNDILYGVESDAPVTVRWLRSDVSRAGLGVPATVAWLDAKLRQPEVFNTATIARQRAEVLAGTGETYFEIILSVFADHPRISLDLC